MSEEMIIRHCSPTLAGIKTGSMFNCRFDSYNELINQIRKLNKSLSRKGLRVLPLRVGDSSALVYFYRPSKLENDLDDHLAISILKSCGYCTEKPQQCLIQLISRLKDSEVFPHEIGLFLGYPPEDVYGFITYGAKESKCVGNWRVYGDEEKARETFARYRKCTQLYMRQHNKGNTIERLTVAV